MSVAPELLTDIGWLPDSSSSNPHSFIAVGDLTYFVAKAKGASTESLWISNGTANSTRMVSEALPGGIGNAPARLSNVAGSLYFSANGAAGRVLWKIEDLETGVEPVIGSSGVQLREAGHFVNVGGVYYFGGTSSAAEQAELWRTDGTAAGTYRVKEIRPGAAGGVQPFTLWPNFPTMFNVAGSLLFVANDGVSGNELWRSDGTEAGTTLVQDIQPGVGSSLASPGVFEGRFEVVDDVLYFAAESEVENSELWRSDGTTEGTFRVKEIRPGSVGAAVESLLNVNGSLFFSADNGVNGRELWKSDGSENGTTMVRTVNGATASLAPQELTEMNGNVYFQAAGMLWRSDGSEAGTHPVLAGSTAADAGGMVSWDVKESIANVNGTLYFTGRAGAGLSQFALWKSDGTAANTTLISHQIGQNQSRLTNVAGRLYFAATSAAGIQPFGTEPAISDGTAVGTTLLKDITAVGSGGGDVGLLTNVSGRLFFTGTTATQFPNTPRGWWVSTGSPFDTESFQSITGTIDKDSVLGVAGGLLFFKMAGANDADWELWRTDGSAGGTFRAKDIYPGANGAFNLGKTTATEADGVLYFFANDGVHGFELWRSDGTEAGTYLVAESAPGPAFIGGLVPNSLVNVNGTLYFGLRGSERSWLWKSDGTAAGTIELAEFTTAAPSNLLNVNGTLYFSAGLSASETELWRSDGTVGGTFMVKDIHPGASVATSPFTHFSNIGDTLFFIANDGTTGWELWKSDGTAVGTTLVKDIHPTGDGLRQGTIAAPLTVVNSTLFFLANNGLLGFELWRSDGTAAGTALVKDVHPGARPLDSSSPFQPVNVGGLLYFAGYSNELWRSDGTADGTFLHYDLYPLSIGSSPRSLTNVDGNLYFIANDGTHGEELWVVRPDAAAVTSGDYDQNGVTDGADFLKWQRSFGSRDATNDGDGDGVVGVGDLEAWRANFGGSGGATTSGAAISVAALMAEDKESAGAELAATIVDDAGDAQEFDRGTTARDALFAAGDFSRLFGVSAGGEAKGIWRRWGRGR